MNVEEIKKAKLTEVRHDIGHAFCHASAGLEISALVDVNQAISHLQEVKKMLGFEEDE